MKEFKTEQIRNIGVVAHGGAGKTSLVEAMAFTAGLTNRIGSVDEGNTISDFNDDEISRKISISTSLLQFEWKNNKFNLVDMPGYADFVGEILSGLRVTETALILVSAISGVEVGTEQVWSIAEKYGISRAFYINKLDKEHAEFEKIITDLQKRHSHNAVPVQMPIGVGLNFKGIIDLIKMKVYLFEGKEAKEGKIPQELEEKAKNAREKLVEIVAEADDSLLEKFFDKGALTEEEFNTGLRQGIAAHKIFPIFCGSATNNWGVKYLLDHIGDFFPAPSDFKEIKGKKPDSDKENILKISSDGPLASMVFKTVSEPHVGELSFLKVFSGKLKTGDDVFNSSTNSTERIGQIYSMNGRDRRETGFIIAGDVGALVKLKNTHTGDTLCDKKDTIVLQKVEFPTPVINLAIRPKSKGDEEKIANGFSKLHEEDPTFIMEVDADIKQTIIYGQGELHLEIIVDRLKRKFGVEAEIEKPRIPFRETIKARVEAQGKYKRQSGGRGQYGDCWLRLEPLGRGEGFQFVNEIVGGAIPSKYVPAVEKGVVEAMNEGVVAGYKTVDLKVTIYDGTYHEVDSSDMAFKIAGSMGFKKAAIEAKPVLLEPIYIVEVTVPEEFMGDVMGDLSSRRGRILGMESDGRFQKIKAQVPLAELYRYSTTLRSLTQGRGLHSRSFSHYEEVPREITDKIIKEVQAAKEKEQK
ncbi:MAG: elongation factor G [candidate division Zixibacteria bacterium]|nr:elongation factor G [candidate division Zixibacteria bacterium]